MSEGTEPLAAILREMCDGIHTGRADIIDAVNERLRSYADRIKAAVKREREATQGARDMRDALEYALAQKSPKFEQPGNVAALRNALLTARNTLVLYSRDMKPRYQAEVGFMINKCDAALDAPARNVDRFATCEEAVEAYRAWTLQNTGNVSNVSGRGMLGWLFDTAREGGAE